MAQAVLIKFESEQGILYWKGTKQGGLNQLNKWTTERCLANVFSLDEHFFDFFSTLQDTFLEALDYEIISKSAAVESLASILLCLATSSTEDQYSIAARSILSTNHSQDSLTVFLRSNFPCPYPIG